MIRREPDSDSDSDSESSSSSDPIPAPIPPHRPSPTELIIRTEFERIQKSFEFVKFKLYKNRFYDWDITIRPTPTTKFGPILEKAMKDYGIDGLHIRAIFPPDYPYQNVFLCLWYPKIQIRHLYRGDMDIGIICMKINSKSIWLLDIGVEYVLIQYISYINDNGMGVFPPKEGKYDMEISRKYLVERPFMFENYYVPNWLKEVEFSS